MEIKLRDFESQILYFNGMYKLPVAPYPTVYVVTTHVKKTQLHEATSDKDALIRRLKDFKKIINKETDEVDDVVQKIELGKYLKSDLDGDTWHEYTELDCLVDLADWLGDIQVYCASEMAKYGLPIKEVLRIIMSSNFSKLDANGNPIYDAEGKVQKGPMYWKPEPQIKALLQELIESAIAINKPENGIIWGQNGK